MTRRVVENFCTSPYVMPMMQRFSVFCLVLASVVSSVLLFPEGFSECVGCL